MSDAAAPSLLLIGATGPTGREVVAQARAQGTALRALVRRPEAAAWKDGAAPQEVVRGDVMEPASLDAALAGGGIDAVICVLGVGLTFQPVTVLSSGTLHVIEAMRRAGVQRLVCVTGVGAGDSRGHGGFFYDRIVRPHLLPTIYADKDRQEALVRSSRLRWTIVRPGRLVNRAARGRFRVLTDLTGQTLRSIARADVAAFLLREVRDDRHVGQVVNLTD